MGGIEEGKGKGKLSQRKLLLTYLGNQLKVNTLLLDIINEVYLEGHISPSKVQLFDEIVRLQSTNLTTLKEVTYGVKSNDSTQVRELD
jgi:hypothetical protein